MVIESSPKPSAFANWPLVARSGELDAVKAAIGNFQCQAVIIQGPAGVGKTRLAEECLVQAMAAGHTGGRAVASAAAAAIPLGAIAHLLPDTPIGDDPVAAFASAVTALQAGEDARRYVLLVDDLHLLDATSATVISQLLQTEQFFLIGTVREGERRTAAVSSLDGGDRVSRIALGQLQPQDIEALLEQVLGGPVDGQTLQTLCEASGGNLLYLRELVLGALSSGTLTTYNGVSRLQELPVGTGRLAELIEARLTSAGPEGRDALEVLALAAPLELRLAEDQIPAATLERLEAGGLIQVRSDRCRHQVDLAHPLHGEVLRRRIPRLRRRRLLLRQSELLESLGARRRDDPLRIATWRLEATGTADPELLLRAAALARYAFDYGQAARLARAALAQEESFEVCLLLGETLYELGEFEEADDMLQRAGMLATTDDERLLAVVQRDQNLFWGAMRITEALDVNARARESLTSPTARDALNVAEATIRAFSGEPQQALDLLDGLQHVADPRTRVMGALTKTAALAEVGRTTEALALSESAYRTHAGITDLVAVAHPSSQLISQVYALCEAGRLRDAVIVAERAYWDAVADRAPNPQGWLALNLARCHHLAGRAASARRWYAEAAQVSAVHHFTPQRRLAVAGLVLVDSWLGDLPAADTALEEFLALPTAGWIRPDAQLAPAWRLAAAGDLSSARDILGDAAADAQRQGMWTLESQLLSDIARLGDPASVANRLTELAKLCDGQFVAARAEHASALTEHDPGRLADVSARLEALGTPLLAAEAATAAAEAYQGLREVRAATAMSFRASNLAAQCEGARTPGLVRVDSAIPLTRRELDVALLASRGMASREIAERLVLSPRTVNNHLQRAYTKLGVTSRAELAEAMGPPDRDSPVEGAAL
ncbi:LuxR C-terminal-related transcriptional regulator [Streptomyces sp. NPDC001820]|uniref:LuxR C-terminal-related transcriptional regulator n=1 Tax=Streptomyces sp. NPDC001820 TaxID=3364613 RepID=UPI00368D6F66